MRKSVFNVGVDVGKDEIWAAINGYKPRRFKHGFKGVKAMLKWSGKAAGVSSVRFCMESTGVYSQHLAVCLLAFEGVSVSIVNPAQVKAFSRAQLRRTKTDRVDCQVILGFAVSQDPPLWQPQPKAFRQLYQLVRQADTIEKEIRRWTNRQHAQGYDTDLHAQVRNSSRAFVRTLKRELKKTEEAINDLIAEHEDISSDIQLLCSIKGVAELTALRLLAYSQGKMGSLSARALVAHAGLAPGQHQSGTSVHGKSRLNKQGDSRLRKTLYMPALVASWSNPIMKIFYQRLLENGKPKKLALAACMKKLLLMARAILISKKIFDPNFST